MNNVSKEKDQERSLSLLLKKFIFKLLIMSE